MQATDASQPENPQADSPNRDTVIVLGRELAGPRRELGVDDAGLLAYTARVRGR